MITYRELAALRLKDFLPQSNEIEQVNGWEFMDKIWIGEVYGFTEWLRLQEDPDILRSVSLDLAYLDTDVADQIVEKLQVPLEYGLELEEVNKVLGKPVNQMLFVNNRITYEYLIGNSEKYYISATIDQEEGLVYLVVMTLDDQLIQHLL